MDDEDTMPANGIFVSVYLIGDGVQDEDGFWHVPAALEHTPGLTREQVMMVLRYAADSVEKEGDPSAID